MAGLRRLEDVASEITDTDDTDLLYIARGGSASKISVGHLRSNLNNGIIPDERLPPRLREVAQITTNWDDATENGWFRGNDAANAPAPGWFMGQVVVHHDLWTTQVVHAFSDDTEVDTKTYRREKNNGAWGGWYRLRVSEVEQSIIYRNAGNLNAGTVPLARLAHHLPAGSVGTFLFARRTVGGVKTLGSVVPGSELKPSTAYGEMDNAAVISGSWRLLGYDNGGGDASSSRVSLWLRIA